MFGIQLGLPFVLAAVIAVALCALTGHGAGPPRSGSRCGKRGLGLTQLMVVTIGLQLALEYLYQYIFGGGVRNISRTIQANTGPLNITPNAYIAMGISLVVLIAVGLLLHADPHRPRDPGGRRTTGRSPPPPASTWTGSSGSSGRSPPASRASPACSTRSSTAASPGTPGAELLLLLFAAVTLGGLGTAFGALVGSLIIGLVTQLSSLVLTAQLRYASALLILIVVLIFRPQGILGRKSRVG